MAVVYGSLRIVAIRAQGLSARDYAAMRSGESQEDQGQKRLRGVLASAHFLAGVLDGEFDHCPFVCTRKLCAELVEPCRFPVALEKEWHMLRYVAMTGREAIVEA
jgi:hypothetical protein